MLSIRGLDKTFPGAPPVAALRAVDLDVGRGEIFSILGPSGCGKTTLLRIVAGFESADTGSVAIDGDVVDDGRAIVAAQRRRVGIVPQEGGLFPHLDVAGNVAFGLRRLDRRERRRRVAELLELVDLAGFASRRPHELSGGQQQRVALARALAPQPAVVLLDEPFTALDVALRASLRDEVATVLRARGTTAVVVTHDHAEALGMSDRVAVMRAGAVIQVGRPADVYRRPADVATAGLVGECSVIGGVSDGVAAATTLGRLVLDQASSPPAGDVEVVLRPEQLVVGDASGVAATVRSLRYEGATIRAVLSVAGDELIARWPAASSAAVGDVVAVRVTGDVVAHHLHP